jgi:hypothetical protein
MSLAQRVIGGLCTLEGLPESRPRPSETCIDSCRRKDAGPVGYCMERRRAVGSAAPFFDSCDRLSPPGAEWIRTASSAQATKAAFSRLLLMHFLLRLLMYFLSGVDMRVQATIFAARAASSPVSVNQPNTHRTGFAKRRRDFNMWLSCAFARLRCWSQWLLLLCSDQAAQTQWVALQCAAEQYHYRTGW